MRSICLFALPLLAFGGPSAHADTLDSFNCGGSSIFYGMAGDTHTVSGTATIDITTGQVESISFAADGQWFSGVSSESGAEVFVGPSNAAFSFSAASLIGYTGSTFNLNGAGDLYVGSLTAASSSTAANPLPPPVDLPAEAAITPEPESLFLLSTGMLGLALLCRRAESAGS